MRNWIKTLSLAALASSAYASNYKRDPYWIKMADVINQVRPDFYFGIATTKAFFANPKYKDIVSTFNLHVAGNECKFYTIQGSETFNTAQCDASIDFAKQFKAKYRGHNLFWPANSPSWFKNWEHKDDSEMVKEYVLNYITKVLDYYKDDEDIIYWDVINESVTDDSTENSIKLRTGSDTDTLFKDWTTYTEDIFTLAREHTNPNVKLFYNDYNAENNNGNYQGKTGAVFNYIKSMKDKGVPIDGVGFQMHISCNYYPNYDQLYSLISKYEEIGVEVHVTEIDVSMKNCNTYEEQTKLYMDVFKACFDHENCKVFTVWGGSDSESWIGAENEPLIFDNDYYPKQVYFDMLKYVMDQLSPDATYPIPTSTVRPSQTTSSGNVENALNIVMKDSYMIDAAWQNWSWATDSDFDDEGNIVAQTTAENYGALSFKSSTEFNGGKMYFDIKTNSTASPVKLIFHAKEAGFVTIATLEDVPLDELKSYVIEVPDIENDIYNRISFQDAYGAGLKLTMNNIYYVPKGEETEVPSGNTLSIIKEGDYMIAGGWQNWSWGATADFDESGNLVGKTDAGSYGGVSFKKTSGEFGAGTLFFKAMVNDTSATLQILFHTTADEFVNIGQFNKISGTTMTQYSIKVEEPTAEKYDRITFQDVSNNGLTIYLNDVYFVEATEEEQPTPTETVAPTTTTTTEQPTATETPADDCWSEALGYSCCKVSTAVVFTDESGKWSVEDGQWCGLIENPENNCWSLPLGYPCCETSTVIYDVDSNGSWGYENDTWCGMVQSDASCEFTSIGYSCCPNEKVIYEDDHEWAYIDGQWCGVKF